MSRVLIYAYATIVSCLIMIHFVIATAMSVVVLVIRRLWTDEKAEAKLIPGEQSAKTRVSAHASTGIAPPRAAANATAASNNYYRDDYYYYYYYYYYCYFYYFYTTKLILVLSRNLLKPEE